MAFQCEDGEKSIDFCIPTIRASDLNTPIRVGDVSRIRFPIVNRIDTTSFVLDPLISVPVNNSLPFISIVLQLGEPRLGESFTGRRVEVTSQIFETTHRDPISAREPNSYLWLRF